MTAPRTAAEPGAGLHDAWQDGYSAGYVAGRNETEAARSADGLRAALERGLKAIRDTSADTKSRQLADSLLAALTSASSEAEGLSAEPPATTSGTEPPDYEGWKGPDGGIILWPARQSSPGLRKALKRLLEHLTEVGETGSAEYAAGYAALSAEPPATVLDVERLARAIASTFAEPGVSEVDRRQARKVAAAYATPDKGDDA